MSGILVGGMHFSGLDLATSALERAGWVLTRGPRAHQARGTTKDDPTLVSLHLEWLRSTATPPHGLPSWGVVGELDIGTLTAQALADPNPLGLTAVCQQFDQDQVILGTAWVAQDAMSVFAARIWAEVTPVHFVLVYRNPWDCVDAAVRSSTLGLVDDPDLVRRTWLEVNQQVLGFARDFPDRCTVVAAEALAADPGAIVRHLDTERTAPAEHDEIDLAVRDDSSPIAWIYRRLYPELTDLLDELDHIADIPRPTSRDSAIEQFSKRVVPAGTLPAGTGTQVVVVCRDDVAFIAETVASVIESAVAASRDVELTIVDDGSADTESLQLLQRLREAELGVLTTSGLGQSSARNLAVAASGTACVLPLDPRARLLPPLLQRDELVTSGVADVVFGPWHEFGPQSELSTPPEPTALTLFPHNTMPDTALVARSTMMAVGGWDEGTVWPEWDFWLSCLGRGTRFHLLTEPTFESWGGPTSTERADPAMRERGLQATISKHAALLSPYLGSYIAGLDAEVGRLRADLSLSRNEVVMAREVATKANLFLKARWDEARAATSRLQRELEARVAQGPRHLPASGAAQPRRITVDDPLLFLHIPKTGGTAFRRMLQVEFGEDLVFPSDSDLKAAPRPRYPETERVIESEESLPSHAVLIGHFDAGLIDALRRDYRTALFLRDPVERVLSELAWRSDLDGRDVEFYLQRPDFLTHRVANMLTRFLGGKGIHEPVPLDDETFMETAWKRLADIDFVGLTEDYFTSCVRFDEIFGTTISKAIIWDNVTRPRGDELAKYASEVAPYVELDQVLYQRAVAKIAAEWGGTTR